MPTANQTNQTDQTNQMKQMPRRLEPEMERGLQVVDCGSWRPEVLACCHLPRVMALCREWTTATTSPPQLDPIQPLQASPPAAEAPNLAFNLVAIASRPPLVNSGATNSCKVETKQNSFRVRPQDGQAMSEPSASTDKLTGYVARGAKLADPRAHPSPPSSRFTSYDMRLH